MQRENTHFIISNGHIDLRIRYSPHTEFQLKIMFFV